MAKLSQLIQDSRWAATQRGHRMQRFTHEGTTSAYSYCRTGCGMGVFVHTNPSPNGIEIHGRAVAMNCPNREINR